jgi:flavin-dependent dehydrogenase
VGAGLAGLAACIFLRNAGLRVLCVDRQPYPHQKVGESLDWSSPALLARLGIDPAGLIRDGIATWKKGIAVCEPGTPRWSAAPPPLIRRPPLGFETVTLHVDRSALDGRLYERARDLGTTFLWRRVSRLDRTGDRVTACIASDNGRIEADWYIDATGTARLFSRVMDIPVTKYGRPKICLWTYFDTPPLGETTTFFADGGTDYLEWIWDIPISPRRTSVGWVVAADTARVRRRSGATLETVLRDELARHPRFGDLLARTEVLRVERTAFQPYVTSRVCGSNWLMVGEAASMPDPLTGNGVTSAIRHARHASSAILHAARRGALAPDSRRMYERHVGRLGRSFNAHIEDAIYLGPIRRAFSLQTATYVYTSFAFFMNALHARFDPRGRPGMAVFALLFAAARAWIGGWTWMARAELWRRALHASR